ncbi:hypothetical protein IPH19_02475 [Candidatus Uhrbacteria bacterium]|nr:MAG: hypothetical protein IPH19_02475 [Candidatus Uhrbacteria bacterium]
MKTTNLFLVSFAIGFVLTLGLASIADAQDRIVPPEGASPPCLQHFNELYEDGTISLDDAAALTNTCVDADRTVMTFYETLYDRLNGTGGRPHFTNMGEVREAFTMCREVEVCPRDPEAPSAPRTRRRLVVEARGPHHMEGRGWNRQVICEDGTEPVEVPWNRARSEGESRRRAEPGVTLVIIHCVDYSNPAAPPIAREEAEDDLEDVGRNYAFLTYYCSPTLPEGVVRDAAWAGFCNSFDEFRRDLDEFRGDLNTMRGQITSILTRLGALEGGLSVICDIDPDDYPTMTRDQVMQACLAAREDYLRDSVGSGNGWHLRFHLGLAFHGLGITAPAGILAPHGVVYAEIEALPVEHFGFFLRGYVGAGNLLDRIGQFNPDGTIGDEGIFGGSAGATFRFDEMFALDVGLAASAVFNPGGQIGRSLHTWPVFQLGGEVRLRVNPLPWLHIEGTAGLDYTHTEVRRPNVDHFVGVDGVGYVLSLGGGVSF